MIAWIALVLLVGFLFRADHRQGVNAERDRAQLHQFAVDNRRAAARATGALCALREELAQRVIRDGIPSRKSTIRALRRLNCPKAGP